MANNIRSNPLVFDTVAADFTDQTQVWPGRALVRALEFSGYALATDSAQLVDRDGKVIWAPTGNADFSPVNVGVNKMFVNGIRLAALSDAASKVRVFIG